MPQVSSADGDGDFKSARSSLAGSNDSIDTYQSAQSELEPNLVGSRQSPSAALSASRAAAAGCEQYKASQAAQALFASSGSEDDAGLAVFSSPQRRGDLDATLLADLDTAGHHDDSLMPADAYAGAARTSAGASASVSAAAEASCSHSTSRPATRALVGDTVSTMVPSASRSLSATPGDRPSRRHLVRSAPVGHDLCAGSGGEELAEDTADTRQGEVVRALTGQRTVRSEPAVVIGAADQQAVPVAGRSGRGAKKLQLLNDAAETDEVQLAPARHRRHKKRAPLPDGGVSANDDDVFTEASMPDMPEHVNVSHVLHHARRALSMKAPFKREQAVHEAAPPEYSSATSALASAEEPQTSDGCAEAFADFIPTYVSTLVPSVNGIPGFAGGSPSFSLRVSVVWAH